MNRYLQLVSLSLTCGAIWLLLTVDSTASAQYATRNNSSSYPGIQSSSYNRQSIAPTFVPRQPTFRYQYSTPSQPTTPTLDNVNSGHRYRYRNSNGAPSLLNAPYQSGGFYGTNPYYGNNGYYGERR